MTTQLSPSEIAARLQPFLHERENHGPIAGFLQIASAVRRFLARVWTAISFERKSGIDGLHTQTADGVRDYSEIRCSLHANGLTLNRGKTRVRQF